MKAAWLGVGFVAMVTGCQLIGGIDDRTESASSPGGSNGSGGVSSSTGGRGTGAVATSGGAGGLPGTGANAGTGGRPPGPDGQVCVLSSDCNDANLRCIFGTCSVVCRLDRDCEPGFRCLDTVDGAACVQSSSATCDPQHPCPGGAVCIESLCRNPCTSGAADGGAEAGTEAGPGTEAGTEAGPRNDAGSITDASVDSRRDASVEGGLKVCRSDQTCVNGGCVGTSTHETPEGGTPGSGGAGGGGGVGGAGTGGASGVCTPNATRCNASGNLETCTAQRQWGAGTPCTYVCENDACTGECKPGSKQCGANDTPETCDTHGVWVSGTPCAAICSNGNCGTNCTPNDKDCTTSNTPRTCDATGKNWVSGTPCVNQTCDTGVCTGVCAPNAARCSPTTPGTPQTCGAKGVWQNGAACTYVCGAGTGTCGGVCKPGDIRCNGSTLQTCQATGQWNAGTACPFGCQNNACNACSPGSKGCSVSNAPQQCNTGGQWEPLPACTPAAPSCSNGGCICTQTVCGGNRCVNTDTAVNDCGDCSHSCQTTNTSGRACSGGLCAPTCQSGYQDCNHPVAPTGDDGCECRGTGCCGSSCQVQHNNGAGDGSQGFAQSFYNCSTGTDAIAALAACEAFRAAKIAACPSCSNGTCYAAGQYCSTTVIWYQYSPQYQWGFSGALAGQVYAYSNQCATAADTPVSTWN